MGFYHFEVDKVKGGWVIMGASPHTPFMENENRAEKRFASRLTQSGLLVF